MSRSKWNTKIYIVVNGKRKQIRLYNIWKLMLYRCSNPKHIEYYNYGARGISVCNEWLNFDNFYEWAMRNGYRDDLTLDRKENNKGYFPENCRWATSTIQMRNRRDNLKCEDIVLSDLAETYGFKADTLRRRYKNGCVNMSELLKPLKNNKPILVEGKTFTELANISGISRNTIRDRYHNGKTTLEELLKPVRGS